MYYTVTRATVHQRAAGLLRSCLRLEDFSPACTAGVLLHVLFAACARLCSISAACWSLATAPSRETVRKALLRSLADRDELLRRLNRALVADVPRAFRKRPQQVAIDLTLIPYHGQPMLDLEEVYRSQAKSGTSHFHAYATAYVNYRGQRFTLALTVVERGEKMEEVLERLLRRLGRLGIGVRMLLLDRLLSGAWRRFATCKRHAAVPDAGDTAGPRRGPPRGARRHADIRLPQEGRLGRVHADVRRRHDGAGVDLRALSQLRRAVGAARQADPGVRLPGAAAVEHEVGARDVPEALRDRDELPADAPGQGADVYAEPAGEATAGGHSAGAAQRVGVAALRGPLDAPAGWPEVQLGQADAGDDAAVAASPGGGGTGSGGMVQSRVTVGVLHDPP